MGAAQHVSGPARAITIVLVLVFLGGSYLAVMGARDAIRRHRPRRWPRERR